MSLGVSINSDGNKKLFNLPPKCRRNNGLIVRIYHEDEKSYKARFLHCCYSNTSRILACADNKGNIFIINFILNKFWKLPSINSCTLLYFSTYNLEDILIGLNDGRILLADIETGNISGELIGHKQPATRCTFSENNMCVTYAECEAITWDLRTNTKLQILALVKGVVIKQVVFRPVTNDIVTCLSDNVIQIWKTDTYQVFKQISPTIWNNFTIKCLILTKNGNNLILALGGLSPHIAIFKLCEWKLSSLVALPEYILSIKDMKLISQSFDNNCDNILAILSGQSIIYFYDISENKVMSEITSYCEIISFVCHPSGSHIACCLCLGEVEVYELCYYITKSNECYESKAISKEGKIRLRKDCSKIGFVKQEINNILDIEKLKGILRMYGEYPEMYRVKIWEQLLELPNNNKLYNEIINRVTMNSFDDLYTQYPLENKQLLVNLRKLLNNVVTWCPFFAQVNYLPYLLFPFVKVFNNKPISCFEAICTIILNWCQHWFEYFPLPPINILAMIENILLEHDPDLLGHFINHNITSKIYAWPLLETTFSEILTAPQWLIFWDHMLTNEPSLVICAAVAYLILHRTSLLNLKTKYEVCILIHSQNRLDIKKFLTKCYSILNNTSNKMHPRQYLNMFSPLKVGEYLKFIDYPKAIVDYQNCIFNKIKRENKTLEIGRIDMLEQQHKERFEMANIEIEDEEKRRVSDMENALKKMLIDEQKKISSQQLKLSELREKLESEENEILVQTKQKILESDTKQKQQAIESLMLDLKLTSSMEDYKTKKAEEKLINRHNELLKHKFKIQSLLTTGNILSEDENEALKLNEDRKTLSDEMKQIADSVKNQEHLKQLNLATGITAINELIHRVEEELMKDKCLPRNEENVDNNDDRERLRILELESKDLELQIMQLLQLLGETKIELSKSKLETISEK